MNDTVIMTRDPVVRVEDGTWCRVVDVDGMGLRRALSFERGVTWLRQAHAQARLLNKAGREVDSNSSYCDVGYFMSCLASAVDDARAMARDHGVGDGPFRVEARLDVVDVPVLPLKPEPWDTESTPPRYRPVPRDWIAHGVVEDVERWRAMPDKAKFDGTGPIRYLGEAKVVEEAVAWSSAWRPDECAAAMERAVASALVGMAEDVAAAIRRRLAKEFAESVPA